MDRKEKEEKVYNIFEKIAGNYDKANDRMSFGMQRTWKQHLIDSVFESKIITCAMAKDFGYHKDINQRKSQDEHADDVIKMLDICCGTGDIAIALANRARQEGLKAKVTGLDFSPAMLEIAKSKDYDETTVTFIQGSAMQLPFEDNSFDAVTVSFGLRNTPDYSIVLNEMKRVLKPDGSLFVLDSFEVKKGIVYPFYKFYFGKLIPIFESKYKAEYKWLNQSTELFLSPEELAQLMKTHKLENVKTKKFLFGACCLLSGRK